MKSFKAQDGKVVRDGETYTLRIQKGPNELVHRGEVRCFQVVDILEEKQDGELVKVERHEGIDRWEIVFSEPSRPQDTAIGFAPENIISVD